MDKIEIELQLASQILQEPALLSSLSVSLEEFSSWEAVHCIKAVAQMEKDGVRVTRAELSRITDTLDRSRITTIWNTAQTRANFKHHVKALNEIVKAEKLSNLALIIQDSRRTESADQTIERIETYLHEIAKQSSMYEPMILSDAIRDSIDRLEERIKKPGMHGITTGFFELNRMFGGFEPGKLYYVGARPSAGKTALMLNFALNALSSGAAVGIISVESNARELSDRILAIDGSVNSMNIKRGDIKPSESDKLTNSVTRLYDKPGLIYHNPYATISDVSIQGRRMMRNHGIQVLFLDYIQLLRQGGDKWRKPRHQQVAGDSRDLKALAEDLGIPIVALAQVGRSADGKKPTISDLRESGDLEQDGDVIMFIYHEDRDGMEYSAIDVAKARDGIVGECPVRFTREYLKFTEES